MYKKDFNELTYDEIATIIYNYTVKGISTASMNVVAYYTQGDYLHVLRMFGFNPIVDGYAIDRNGNNCNSQQQHYRRFSHGYCSKIEGEKDKIYTVNKELIIEYLQSGYASDVPFSFEAYLDNKRKNELVEEKREAERRAREAEALRRQRQMEAEERRRQAELERARAEQERLIRQNTEKYQSLCKQGEALINIDPEKAIQKFQQASNIFSQTNISHNTAEEKINYIREQQRKAHEAKLRAQAESEYKMGKSDFNNGHYKSAVNHFNNTRKYGYNPPDISYFIAQSIKRYSDKNGGMLSEDAKIFISEMNDYLRYLGNNGGDIYADYYISLAEAYEATGQMNELCDSLFHAGDKFYDKEAYEKALELYEEAIQKSGMWSVNSKDAPFRIAYAITQCRDLDNPTHKNAAISWFRTAAKNNIRIETAVSNIMVFCENDHEEILGLYKDFSNAFSTEYLLKKLFEAQTNKGQYISAADTADKLFHSFKTKLPTFQCAVSYAARGNARNSLHDLCTSADMFFSLGDSFFEENNFSEANKYYTMGYERTGLWSIKSKDAPYKMAYSRLKNSHSPEDVAYARTWFKAACNLRIRADESEQYLKELESEKQTL